MKPQEILLRSQSHLPTKKDMLGNLTLTNPETGYVAGFALVETKRSIRELIK